VESLDSRAIHCGWHGPGRVLVGIVAKFSSCILNGWNVKNAGMTKYLGLWRPSSSGGSGLNCL